MIYRYAPLSVLLAAYASAPLAGATCDSLLSLVLPHARFTTALTVAAPRRLVPEVR